jgi:hypothetical protein
MAPIAQCLFCGGDRTAPDHLAHCDGRQGHVEAGKLPSLREAFRQRDVGMGQVLDKAERTAAFDAEAAAGALVAYLQQHGPTPGEELVLVCRAAGHVPHDDRAFGPVFLRLLRRGRIQAVGTVKRRRGRGADGAHVYALVG